MTLGQIDGDGASARGGCGGKPVMRLAEVTLPQAVETAALVLAIRKAGYAAKPLAQAGGLKR